MCKIIKTEIFEKSPKAPSEKSVRMLERGGENEPIPERRNNGPCWERNRNIETSGISQQKAKLK